MAPMIRTINTVENYVRWYRLDWIKGKVEMGEVKVWGHDELMRDLVCHMRTNSSRMVWCDIPMGSAGSCRPDVFTMMKSFTNPLPTTYEIKVSRADFLSDITSGKYQKYFKFSGAVLFAVPNGLIKKSELPDGCGLIVRHDSSWRTVRRPTQNRVNIPWEIMQKLLLDGVDRISKDREIYPRKSSSWDLSKEARTKLGDDICRMLKDTEAAESRLDGARTSADRIISSARVLAETMRSEESRHVSEIRLKLIRILNAKEGTSLGLLADNLEGYVHSLITRLEESSEIELLNNHLSKIAGIINSAGRFPQTTPHEARGAKYREAKDILINGINNREDQNE